MRSYFYPRLKGEKTCPRSHGGVVQKVGPGGVAPTRGPPAGLDTFDLVQAGDDALGKPVGWGWRRGGLGGVQPEPRAGEESPGVGEGARGGSLEGPPAGHRGPLPSSHSPSPWPTGKRICCFCWWGLIPSPALFLFTCPPSSPLGPRQIRCLKIILKSGNSSPRLTQGVDAEMRA